MDKKESKQTSNIIRPKGNPNQEGDVCSIKQKYDSVIEFFAIPYSKKAKKYGRSFWRQNEEIRSDLHYLEGKKRRKTDTHTSTTCIIEYRG